MSSDKQCTQSEKYVAVGIALVINLSLGMLGVLVLSKKPIPTWLGWLVLVMAALGVLMNIQQLVSGKIPGCK
jgi:hypothetical protein